MLRITHNYNLSCATTPINEHLSTRSLFTLSEYLHRTTFLVHMVVRLHYEYFCFKHLIIPQLLTLWDLKCSQAHPYDDVSILYYTVSVHLCLSIPAVDMAHSASAGTKHGWISTSTIRQPAGFFHAQVLLVVM